MQENEWDRSDPAGVRPVRSGPSWRLLVTVVILVGIVGASLIVPVPATLLFVPGPVRDVERLVEVDGEPTYSSEGQLYLTTVSVDDNVTVAEWVMSFFDPAVTAVSEEAFTQGLPVERLEEVQKEQMEESKQAAAVVALDALGIAHPRGDGVEVEGVDREPALGDLRVGDVIVSIDDKSTGTICALLPELRAHRPGEVVKLEVLRNERERSLDLELGERPGTPGQPALGVILRTDYEFDPGFDYEFKTGRIAGPSAGLMFALGLYDRLTPDDLTAGRAIAGTGTIECDGTVGAIGGIEQKVVSAEDEGAEVFLAPAGNAAAAERMADDIDIVSVERFEDALEYLQGLE